MFRFSRRRIVLAVAVAVTVSGCTGTDTNDGEEVALGPEPAWAIPIDKTELSATYGVPSVTRFGDILVYGNSDAARQEGISFTIPCPQRGQHTVLRVPKGIARAAQAQ